MTGRPGPGELHAMSRRSSRSSDWLPDGSRRYFSLRSWGMNPFRRDLPANFCTASVTRRSVSSADLARFATIKADQPAFGGPRGMLANFPRIPGPLAWSSVSSGQRATEIRSQLPGLPPIAVYSAREAYNPLRCIHRGEPLPSSSVASDSIFWSCQRGSRPAAGRSASGNP